MNTNLPCYSDLDIQLNNDWSADTLYQRDSGKKMKLCSIPYILSKSEYQNIYESTKTLNRALERIACYLIEDKPDHPDFSNHTEYSEFNQAPRKHGRLTFLSRMDFIVDTDGQPRFIEINSACPGLLFFAAKQRKLSGQMTGMETTEFPFLLDQHHYITSKMIGLAKQYYAAPERPHVAVVTGKINTTVELPLIARRFEESGASVWRGPLESLNMIDNRLCDSEGRPVDLLYLKDNPPPSINKGWVKEDYSRYAGYLEAVRRDVVCALNPFPGLTVMDDKGLFAFIWTDEANFLFDEQLLKTLRKLVPETRLVKPSDPQQIQQLVEQQSELILKPRLESRSRSIILGKDVDSEAWKQALTSCQTQQWIVQKFYQSAAIDTACPEQHWSRCVTMGLVDGEPAGMVSRISSGSISSAAAGASLQAIFVRANCKATISG